MSYASADAVRDIVSPRRGEAGVLQEPLGSKRGTFGFLCLRPYSQALPSDAAMAAAGATIGAIELVFRPPRLLNLPALNLYRIAIDAPLRQALSLSRADLAAAMLASISDRRLFKHAVQIAE